MKNTKLSFRIKKKNDLQKIPYRLIRNINNNQKKVANIILESLRRIGKPVRVILGFGSFWQNPEELTGNSDIDFFVLVSKQFTLAEILKLHNVLTKNAHNQKIKYPLSPNIFVGSLSNVANGAENFIRCLTIHKSNIASPVIIKGDKNIHLLRCIDSRKLSAWFSESLFVIMRHFNSTILKEGKEIFKNKKFILEQQKFIRRYIEAYFLAQKLFPRHIRKKLNQSKLAKFLNKKLSLNDIIEVYMILCKNKLL
ncbi:MAG TPA: hypothetical protein PLQ44_02000 [Candidatus Paceibacterota bacterium]|nr:hypothetical protein [Candidatus Paceibacterota bacterium]HPT40354.1 hypothetical protein [Candidatus Paceibacterota bacterium]